VCTGHYKKIETKSRAREKSSDERFERSKARKRKKKHMAPTVFALLRQ
jgi:hypothetical protein